MSDYGTELTDRAVRETERRLSRVYREAARDIKSKMKDWEKTHAEREKKYRQQLADGKITQADFDAWMRGQVFQGSQWKARQEQINQILLNADKAAAQIVNEGKMGVFAANANYVGYELERGVGVRTGFNLYDQNTVSRLIRKDPDMLPKAREGVQKDKSYRWYNKQVASAVTQGIVQGEGVREIAQRIVDKTSEGNYKSAIRHARTAYTGAQNAGRMEGLHQAQELGINVKKQWVATNDDRTRDTHAELDGQIRDVDEPFEVDGMEIDYPGDPSADPSLVYNCRCTLVYVYPDYPSDKSDGEPTGDASFEEWEDMKREDQGQEDVFEDVTEPEFDVDSIEIPASRLHPDITYGSRYFKDVISDDNDYREQIKGMPHVERTVKISDLITDQETNRVSDVRHMLTLNIDKPVVVVKVDGEYILLDGNTRAIAKKLRGNDRIKAIVYDLDRRKHG